MQARSLLLLERDCHVDRVRVPVPAFFAGHAGYGKLTEGEGAVRRMRTSRGKGRMTDICPTQRPCHSASVMAQFVSKQRNGARLVLDVTKPPCPVSSQVCLTRPSSQRACVVLRQAVAPDLGCRCRGDLHAWHEGIHQVSLLAARSLARSQEHTDTRREGRWHKPCSQPIDVASSHRRSGAYRAAFLRT